MTVGELRVGTSGWSYDHWRGVFYPEDLPASRRLAYYAERFSTVEINSTFYGLPKSQTVEHWKQQVPDDFIFAVKGSRYITHIRRIDGIDEEIARFMERVEPLAPKLGPVLWQLPPTLKFDRKLLEGFVSVLATTAQRHALEFRDGSWLADETYQVLREYGIAVVQVSGDLHQTDFRTTTDLVYVRFHGTTRYHGSYSGVHLRPWKAFLEEQSADGADCFAYFNNDVEGHAPQDAVRLREMLGQECCSAGKAR